MLNRPEYAGDALQIAMEESIRRLQGDDQITAANTSAGMGFFEPHDPENPVKYQVFVRVCRYSEDALRECPESGGLLCEVEKLREHGVFAGKGSPRREDEQETP